MNKHQWLIDNVPVTVRISRSRNISITVAPFAGVTMSIPVYASRSMAEDFFRSRIKWVRENITRMQDIESASRIANNSVIRLARKESRIKLIRRLYELAHQHCLHYNRISIRDQKTVWGSCSIKNNINLNIRLAWLPDELIDYVILHELMHTKIRNHKEEFWNALEEKIASVKSIREKLKSYRYLYYLPID